MNATTRTLVDGRVSAVDYRCGEALGARPFAEVHRRHSVSFVVRGSFGCRCMGVHHELVPGALLVGRPGDEYTCTHEHRDGGDVCLAFFFDEAIADEIDGRRRAWRTRGVPPLAALAALGAIAERAARGDDDRGLDEIGLALAARFVEAASGVRRRPATATAADRRRAIAAAMRIDAAPGHAHPLDALAADAGVSPYHFVRTFAAALRVTPHQYLLRRRLARAARLLADGDAPVTEVALDAGFADLSNFVRTFGRATGATPGAFRRLSRGDRKILQDRLAPPRGA